MNNADIVTNSFHVERERQKKKEKGERKVFSSIKKKLYIN